MVGSLARDAPTIVPERKRSGKPTVRAGCQETSWEASSNLSLRLPEAKNPSLLSISGTYGRQGSLDRLKRGPALTFASLHHRSHGRTQVASPVGADPAGDLPKD